MDTIRKRITSLTKSLFRHNCGNGIENSTITFLTHQLIHPPIYSCAEGRTKYENGHKPEEDIQERSASARSGRATHEALNMTTKH